MLSSETEILSPAKNPLVGDSNEAAPYILGANDVISVSVYLHPELSAPSEGSATGNGGVLVTSDGSIDLPLVGQVQVGGLTISQAQDLIASDLAVDIKNPNVTIQLIQPDSLHYYLLGAFALPGVKYPGHNMTLLEALALGGSVDIANADLYQSYVARGSTKLPVDLHDLLQNGDLSQNIELDPGDAVVIPSSSSEDAFIFGSVGKPGAVPFQSGTLSLLQALTVAGLDLPNYTAARLSQVHVIRSHGNRADFMVVDANRILNGAAFDFGLQPGDVVFVPPTSVASWNQVLTMLIPSLNTVSDLLSPFVSIKYLSQ